MEGTDQSMVVAASASLISQGFSSRVVMPECNGVGLPLDQRAAQSMVEIAIGQSWDKASMKEWKAMEVATV